MMAKEIGTGEIVLDKPTEPLRRGTEQEQKLDIAMARIQEARLRIKGNPRCTLGCNGRGYIGIRTLPMTNGGWDVYLEPCKCSKPSEYALLSDQLKQLGERVNQLAAMTLEAHQTVYRHTFYGAIRITWQKIVAFIKRTIVRIRPAKKLGTVNSQPGTVQP